MKFLKTYLLPALFLLAAMGCGQAEAKITQITNLKNSQTGEKICFVEDDGAAIAINEQKEHWDAIEKFCRQNNVAILCANTFLPYTGTRQETKQCYNNVVANIKKNPLLGLQYPKEIQEKISQLNTNISVQALDTRHEITFAPNYELNKGQAVFNQVLIDLCLATQTLIANCTQKITALTDSDQKESLCTILSGLTKKPNISIALNCPKTKKRQISAALKNLELNNVPLDTIQKKISTFKNSLLIETENLVLINLFLELDAARRQNKQNILVYTYHEQFEKTKDQLKVMGFDEDTDNTAIVKIYASQSTNYLKKYHTKEEANKAFKNWQEQLIVHLCNTSTARAPQQQPGPIEHKEITCRDIVPYKDPFDFSGSREALPIITIHPTILELLHPKNPNPYSLTRSLTEQPIVHDIKDTKKQKTQSKDSTNVSSAIKENEKLEQATSPDTSLKQYSPESSGEKPIDTRIIAPQAPATPVTPAPSLLRKLLRPACIVGTLTTLAVCAYKFGPTLWRWCKRSLS